MTTLDEAVTARTQMGADLAAGVDALSYNQAITFDLYVRLVLPADGYVFWVKAAALSESALINAMQLNASMMNQPQEFGATPFFTVKGSLHYATDSTQGEAANYSTNRVVFTSESPVQDFNSAGPDLLYIATVDFPQPGQPNAPASTTPIKFAFSGRGSYYRQTNLWHYTGNAVYSTMATQVVDDPRLLNTRQLIVSNSLPAWLAFNNYNPPWPVPVPRPMVTMFPSFLVPDNRPPPFIAVHVDPDSTEGVSGAPALGERLSHTQLARERVRVTLYGCNNAVAMDYLDSVLQYSYDTCVFGICNTPVPRDAKEGQNELDTLAQKKIIDFEVSYNQFAMRDIARQLITSCTPRIVLGDEIIT